jgi:hypothetical protein
MTGMLPVHVAWVGAAFGGIRGLTSSKLLSSGGSVSLLARHHGAAPGIFHDTLTIGLILLLLQGQ